MAPNVPSPDTLDLPRFSSREPGEPPGTIEDIPEAPSSDLEVVAFGPDDYCAEVPDSIERVEQLREQWPVVWLNVDGVGDAELLHRIGESFEFHHLLLEDIQNYPQRPKWESFDERLYLIALMPIQEEDSFVFDHVGIFTGEGFVVTLQYIKGDNFDPVRDRIRNGIGRIRSQAADYLAYALLDTVVDGFFPLLEDYAAELSDLEDTIVGTREQQVIADIYAAKSDLFTLARAARPQRDMIGSLLRTPGPVLQEETLQYFYDCHEHSVQIYETAETYRQMAGNLLDLNLSLASHRMNEIMKVLTIIATIFIPLTFVAGIYGMNFDPQASPWNMPELQWAYGYPAVLGVMGVTVLGLLWFFKRKGWLWSGGG